MPSKKNKPNEKVETKNETKNGWLINNLEDLKIAFDVHKPTPIERVMAMRLLMYPEYCPFWYQYKIDFVEGMVINSRKYVVADFKLDKYQIAIEVDGKIHETPDNQVKDRYRDMALLSMGIVTFRFDWDDVMQSNDNFDCLSFVTDCILSFDYEQMNTMIQSRKELLEMPKKEFDELREEFIKMRKSAKDIKPEVF